MKILIIGGGGREHAIAAAFAAENAGHEIVLSPGNAGIALEYPCVILEGQAKIVEWCLREKPSLVFIGPEQPLAEGLADLLNEHKIPCIGPSQAAARIETSKIFAKELMAKANVPTASWTAFDDPGLALKHIIAKGNYPLVIKADALAAGKGVFIVRSESEAQAAFQELSALCGTGSSVVVEEFLEGWEVSLFAFTDGEDFQTTLFVQDYKQIGDRDTGPNTGGMGAVCPILEAEPYRRQIEAEIISPILKAMRDAGCPYRGILYCGLMITARGPCILEFNCRLGDPETQALLPLLQTPLSEVCAAILQNRVRKLRLEWKDQYSVCVVLASAGYPGSFQKGFPIRLSKGLASRIYFSGVKSQSGSLITSGGRVLSLVALDESMETARRNVYRDVGETDFTGKCYRSDVSLRLNAL